MRGGGFGTGPEGPPVMVGWGGAVPGLFPKSGPQNVPLASSPNQATWEPPAAGGEGRAPVSSPASVTSSGLISGLLMMVPCGLSRMCQKGAPGPAAGSKVHARAELFSNVSVSGLSDVGIDTLSTAKPRNPL